MRKNTLILLSLGIIGMVFFAMDVCCGSTFLSPFASLSTMDMHILHEIRLPRAITAILAGAALSVCGLLMQTMFRNPLASPYILGVSSGAGLGVAIVTMCGGLLAASSILLSPSSMAIAAVVGAITTMLLVMLISHKVKDNVTLLIVGVMIGAVAGALINIIQNFSNPDALKLFIVWTLGSLSSVGWSELMVIAVVMSISVGILLLLIKPLNGLLLGENYARALGIDVERVRIGLVLVSGLLAGVITAFCGTIAFIGVAVPHIARGLVKTNNHRITIPVCALVGADLLLVCDMLCNLFTYPLPISTMSTLFGAPIILTILLKHEV